MRIRVVAVSRRSDLGDKFFRSGWEANYARYLNLQIGQNAIVSWEFEPERFKFPVHDGPLSYTPDFIVWERDASDHYYVEIKGWMDPKSRTKLQRMKEFYPDVAVRLIGPHGNTRSCRAHILR